MLKSQLVIKITKGDKQRSVGLVNLNLSHYIDKDAAIQTLSIEKCPDTNATA